MSSRYDVILCFKNIDAKNICMHLFLMCVVYMRKYCVGEKICLEILTDLHVLSAIE
jgi:hypothetical protein